MEFLRIVGSLRLAAILLVLALFAMACATIYESAHGAEQAREMFYRSTWFQGLLGLFAVNVLASVIVRYPFSKGQIGFLLTHVGILLTLGGAMITKFTMIDGQLGIAEGETLDAIRLRGRQVLTLTNVVTGAAVTGDLEGRAYRRFDPADDPPSPTIELEDVRVRVARYLPDAAFREQVANDSPREVHAVEVSFGTVAEGQWIFDGRAERFGPRAVQFRYVPDAAELERLTAATPPGESPSIGTVRVEVAGSTFEVPVEEASEGPKPLGDSGYSIRILEYFPHANVGPGNKLVSASDRPENPAIEFELTGEGGTETGYSFARFPDHQSMHGGEKPSGAKIRFVYTGESTSRAPVEILAGPDDALFARFEERGQPATATRIELGKGVAAPGGGELVVRRWFKNARWERVADAVVPARKNAREPAVLVRIEEGGRSSDMWVQKYATRNPLTVDGKRYNLTFSDRTLPLGFQVKLDDFEIGYYPGTRRPRSFESTITILDAGTSQGRVVSMNHPVKYGGFNIFQSSYQPAGGGKWVSFLSVTQDPGQIFAFAGYIATILGMCLVLVTRMNEHRVKARVQSQLQGIFRG